MQLNTQKRTYCNHRKTSLYYTKEHFSHRIQVYALTTAQKNFAKLLVAISPLLCRSALPWVQSNELPHQRNPFFCMIFPLQWLLTSSSVPLFLLLFSSYHRSPPLVLLLLLVWPSNQLHLFVCSSVRSHAKMTRRYHMRNGFSHYEDRRRSINLSSKTANSDTNETLPCEKWF